MSRTQPLARPWLLAIALLIPAGAVHAAGVAYFWEDHFDAAEQDKLTTWIDETVAALQSLVGEFPMGVRIHFHRRDGSPEPVPWANTQRFQGQGVHFHVDPRFDLDAFRRDWTAPHELSHLILPYVGRRGAWFAEGFASYLQYQVMQALGVLSAEQAAQRYRQHFERAEQQYDYPDRPLPDVAPQLRADGKYPVMYWGGAAYFLQVDEALKRSGSSLVAVLRRYQACCRRDRQDLKALLRELDSVAGSDVFTRHYQAFAARPGFPNYREPESDG